MALPPVQFRPESEESLDYLRVIAHENNRSVSDEIRAAVDVYLNLYELARLRGDLALADADAAAAEARLKDNLGRVLLAAIARDARNTFENDVGVEYPSQGFGRLHVPFPKLMDWIVGGASAVRPRRR